MPGSRATEVSGQYDLTMSTLDGAQRGQSANDRLLYLVNRMARAINRASDDVALAHDISLPELMALLVLGEDVGLSNAQLARRTFVTSQSAHQVVLTLTRKGLVERGPHETNRRIIVARMTDAGWAVLEQCRAEITAIEDRLLAQLSARDRNSLHASLFHAAQTLSGGWFGDVEAEERAAQRRAASR